MECPIELQNNDLNIQNHLTTIEQHGLGPADPRQPNNEFWAAKATLWGVAEGDARSRLCANCEHYIATTEITNCIDNGPAISLKASALPLEPKWADIESKPVAFCSLYRITCSPLRTCNDQEPGGPIDDLKMQALKLADSVAKEEIDTEEIVDIVKGIKMPYSMKNIPQWASKKSEAVQRVAIDVFNQTLKDTGSEEKARIASLAAMKNAEESFKKDKVKKSVEDLMKAKYLPTDKQ